MSRLPASMPGDRLWFRQHFSVARARPIQDSRQKQRQCEECQGYFWHAIRVRCVQCNHFRDLHYKDKAKTQNEAGICVCGTKHTDGVNKKYCLCLCKCNDPDEREDSNYEEDSEEDPDDDVETELDVRAKAGEEPLARKYGWRTAGTLDQGKDNERTLFFESPGDRAVAQMHDLGKPEESSLANSDNIVTSIEENNLYKGLEPWEFEAVEQSSGRPRGELLRAFPEARHFQISDADSLRVRPLPRHYCRNCHRPFSLDTMDHLAHHIMEICEACSLVQRPANPMDDPEWYQFNPSIDGTMEHCHCRCRCSPEDAVMTSPTEAVDQPFAHAALHEQERRRQDMEPREHALEQEMLQQSDEQEDHIRQVEEQVVRFEELHAQQQQAIIQGRVNREFGNRQLNVLQQQIEDHLAYIEREREQDRALIAEAERLLNMLVSNANTINIRHGRRGQVTINTSVPRGPQDFYSSSPSPTQVEMAVRAYADNRSQDPPTEEDVQAQNVLRSQAGLPELRFSNLRDRDLRTEENARFALEDAQVAHAFGEHREARQYANVAREIGYQAGFGHEHGLIVEAGRHIDELEGITAV